MTRLLFLLAVLATNAAALLFPASADAQATRTWVSGVGDDVNPCSRTAPCKTFAGAISKTADRGEINCIDPGGFGAVTITKNITIDCGGTHGSILGSLVNGVTINNANPALPLDVTLRNISINGAGNGLNGVRALLPGSLHVENVTIFNFTGKGLDIQPNQGTLVVSVVNSTIHLNDDLNGGGIFVKPGASGSAKVTVRGSTLDRNLVGARVEDRGTLSISDSSASGNVNNGFAAITGAGGVAQINIVRALIANNGGSGVGTIGAGSTIYVSHSSLFGNGTGFNPTNGTVATTSPPTNDNVGNTNPGAADATNPLQ